MLNREQVKDSLTAYRQRIKSDQAFRQRIIAARKEHAANKSFLQIIQSSFSEALSNAFPSDNYDAGKRVFEEGELGIHHDEAMDILLVEPADSVLRKYVISAIEFDKSALTRTASYLGLPTDRREINAKQSLQDLGKNFIAYKENGSIPRNIIAGLFFILLNLTIVSVKVFISTFKIITEYIAYTLYEFSSQLADKALAKIDPAMSWETKGLLYLSYGLAKTFSILMHIAIFFGRAITSPGKGVMAAAIEGGYLGDKIGGKKSIIGDIVSAIFATTSLTLSVFAYLTIFPIKLTISFTTTIPFLARHLPSFIVKPITFAVNLITPGLTHIGDFIGKFLDPIVGPVATALHEPLTFLEVGLGGFAGIASAAAETSYTLFGSKLLRAITVGIVSCIVTAGTLISSLIRQKNHTQSATAVEEERMTTSTTHNLLKAMPSVTPTQKEVPSEKKRVVLSPPKPPKPMQPSWLNHKVMPKKTEVAHERQFIK